MTAGMLAPRSWAAGVVVELTAAVAVAVVPLVCGAAKAKGDSGEKNAWEDGVAADSRWSPFAPAVKDECFAAVAASDFALGRDLLGRVAALGVGVLAPGAFA